MGTEQSKPRYVVSPTAMTPHTATGPLPVSVGWYIVHTKSQAERLTADALLRKGFSIYLPTATKQIRHARQTRIVARPLFNRYLFVGLDTARPHFSEVRKTHGVEWLVTNVGTPIQVPAKVVEQLRQAEEDGLFDETRPKPKPEIAFAPGDLVRIVNGPLEDFAAVVMSLPSDRRIDVILEMFGRKTKVTVDLANLQAKR